jgi:hypothetical protein
MTKDTVHLTAKNLVHGRVKPGDTIEKAKTREYLYDVMDQHPSGFQGKIKDDFWKECKDRFNISKRAFEQIWTEVGADTGAKEYQKSGPRGPRRHPG